jgi:hypothetical protein
MRITTGGVTLATGVTLIAAALVLPMGVAAASAATAATRYTIRANSTKPAACDNSGTLAVGAWIANKPCGYVIGTALSGWTFDAVGKPSDKGFRFGRVNGDADICGWVAPGTLTGTPRVVGATCSTTTRTREHFRRSFGKDFNAAAGKAHGGSPLTLTTTCPRFYNYFTDSSFDHGRTHDKVTVPPGKKLGKHVLYRYTTRDGRAMMVMDADLGWVFVDRNCGPKVLPFHHNDDDKA